jgi:hypothetical protein
MNQSIRRIESDIEDYKKLRELARISGDAKGYDFWDDQIKLKKECLKNRQRNKLKNNKQRKKRRGF